MHVTPETAKKLKDLAATSGRAPDDIVEDALTGYLEEVASVRKTLDSRYDDLKSSRVKPIDGEEHSGRCAKRASADDQADEQMRLPSRCIADLDEIWEYIAENNVDADDRILAEIHFDPQHARGITTRWDITPGPDYAAVAFQCRARVPHRLRA